MDLLFKALQDPTRRKILKMLKKRDRNAGEIADAFAMTKASISYHLDLLKQAGLVSARRDGQFIVYSLGTTVLDESVGWIMDLIKKEKPHASITRSKKALASAGLLGRAFAGDRG